jgi:type I restriction-modification system DNA methylase subunit
MAQNSKWPTNKDEAKKAISRLENNDTDFIIKRLWEEFEHSITDQEIKEVGNRSSEEWNQDHKHYLLDELASLDIRAGYSSEGFLGLFVKHFTASKFNGVVKSVFDPAFGLGNLLFMAFDGSRPGTSVIFDEDNKEVETNNIIAKYIEGIEINTRTCLFANALGKTFGYNVEVKNSDALRFKEHNPSKHQLVVCEPPFNLKLSMTAQSDFLNQDWSFGQPPAGRADWAWPQIVYKHLSNNGYGFLFTPRGALFRKSPSELKIRAKMISSGAIRAVINLPSGSSSSSRIPSSLIIFAGSEVPRAKRDEVLLLSMPEPESRPGSMQYFSNLRQSVFDVCDNFYDFERGKFERVIGYSAAVGRTDQSLIHNDWNIDPSNFVTEIASGIDTKLSVRNEIGKISKDSNDFNELINQTKLKFNSFTVKAEFTTIGEMIKSGKLIQVTGMTKNELKREILTGPTSENYFTVEDLRRNEKFEATGKIDWERDPDDRPEIRTEANDVVLIKTGKPAAKVDNNGGALLFSPLSVLRITDEGRKVVTPKILAFMLNGEGVKKFMHGSMVGRLEIEKVPIPILSSLNRDEINEKLMIIERLIAKSSNLNNQLHALDLKLSKVLWGEFEGLQEEK